VWFDDLLQNLASVLCWSLLELLPSSWLTLYFYQSKEGGRPMHSFCLLRQKIIRGTSYPIIHSHVMLDYSKLGSDNVHSHVYQHFE